jgi:hypothetical protein
MLNGRCFFSYHVNEGAVTWPSPVGSLKNVPRNDVKNAQPMNIMPAGSAGWSMAQSANVKPRKIGRRK